MADLSKESATKILRFALREKLQNATKPIFQTVGAMAKLVSECAEETAQTRIALLGMIEEEFLHILKDQKTRVEAHLEDLGS